MLNIPETVKTLFKRDGVRKNFRVHFPNGELPDITNENIVQESVKFTESLCSQDVLKFGLTEASVIEFETVGIANMYGMQIECGIEIDLSSLTPAQLNDIASGTWDGVYTDAGSSDIGYAYFRVPYGIFRVESCPRDHQAMAHRKVQAYSVSNFDGNPIEEEKIEIFSQYKEYKPDAFLLWLSLWAYKSADVLSDYGFITESGIDSTLKTDDNTFWNLLQTRGGQYVSLRLYRNYYEFTATGEESLDADSLYSLTVQKSKEQIRTELAEKLSTFEDIDLEASGYNSYTDAADAIIRKMDCACFLKYTIKADFSGGLTSYVQRIPIEDSNFAIYPKIGDSTLVTADVITTYQIIDVNHILTDETYLYNTSVALSSGFQKYKTPTGFVSYPLLLNSTLTTVYRDVTLYSFINAYSRRNLIDGIFELFAKFAKMNRAGGFEQISLDNSAPISIIPGEYSGFWWDEYEVLPIGSVKYNFTNVNNEAQIAVYTFGSGASVYDMTDNEALKYMVGIDEATVKTLLDSYFIPNLAPIAFTPIDLTMKGLPYIEAGDFLAVTAEDGIIANSFNMKQEINGIQVLTANIESTSGDIIESGELE